jgi:CHAT domain-containing protein/tetratricopeptide (TPR) repeat protein
MKVLRPLFALSAISLCLVVGVRPLSPDVAQANAPARHSSRQGGQIEDVIRQAQELLARSESQNIEDHALALETARRALALLQTTTDSASIGRAYTRIARSQFAQSDLAEASQNYERALQIWSDLNDLKEQASALTSLGFIEARKGEWQNSITFLTRAQNLIAEQGDAYEMGRITSGLAYVFNESGLPERGLLQYQRALDYYREASTPREAALTLLEIGNTYYLLRDHAEAITNFNEALAQFAPGSLDAAHCHHYIGKVYGSTGQYDLALRHLQTVVPVYTLAGNLREAADVYALIGQIYQQQGRLEPARRHYQRALKTFTRVSDRVSEAALYYALGGLELRGGEYGLAEDYLRRSIEATEDIRRSPTSSDLAAAFSATAFDRYEKYAECLMRQHAQQPSRGFDVRAFEASELARARSLMELVRATLPDLALGLDPALAQREKSLRQALRGKADFKVSMLSGKYKPQELAALDAELARLEAEYEQVNDSIRALYPAYEQFMSPNAWDLRRIQEQVIADDQTVLLEFVLGADKSYAWAVTRDRITSYELPPRALINEAAEKVYKALSTQPDHKTADEFTPAAQELGRLVLSAVAAELNKRRVIVVADGVLHYIPFQVLPSPADGGEPLIARHEIVNAPSASILGELQQEAARRQPAPNVLAAFGDPVFPSNFEQRKDAGGGAYRLAAVQPPELARWHQAVRDIELDGDSLDPADLRSLHYAKSELANLRAITTGADTLVAEGFDATRTRLIGTDLTQYAILHIATHGLFNPKHPENSGLVLSMIDRGGQAQDGFVGLQDVYSLRAPVNLVVLSACRTALGKDVRGEGLLGLTRGFMYAGASSVVASLWKVDDEATTVLMRQFYINLLTERMPPAEALRAAQNSLRQNPHWRSPYYWAAFTLQGEYRQVIKSTPAASATTLYSKVMAGGAFLSLFAGTGWWYRRRRRRAAKARCVATR